MKLIKYRSRGEEVRIFQEFLNTNGFNAGKTDGRFGTKTRSGCKKFQQSVGLKDDGVCGKNTWAAVEKVIDQSAPQDGKIRVCSFNIKRGFGKIAKQRAFLAGVNPQIVGLQEIYNNINKLKDSQRFYSKFTPTVGKKYGSGIISQYELTGLKTYPLYSGKYENRLLAQCNIKIGEKTVSIYNTHFDQHSEAVRAKEFATVKSVMDNDPNEYKILCGDFNTFDYSLLGENYIVTLSNIYDQVIVTKNIEVLGYEVYPTKSMKLSDHNMVCADLQLI